MFFSSRSVLLQSYSTDRYVYCYKSALTSRLMEHSHMAAILSDVMFRMGYCCVAEHLVQDIKAKGM